MTRFPELNQFPLQTYEKIRYADTDRQGHVNNAVFTTMLETGRVETLYNPEKPLASDNCSFVIAKLTLNFLAEITWPGIADIGTQVARIGTSSVTIEQGIFQDNRCVATAETVVVQMNENTRRSEALNDAAVTALTSLMSPPSSDAE